MALRRMRHVVVITLGVFLCLLSILTPWTGLHSLSNVSRSVTSFVFVFAALSLIITSFLLSSILTRVNVKSVPGCQAAGLALLECAKVAVLTMLASLRVKHDNLTLGGPLDESKHEVAKFLVIAYSTFYFPTMLLGTHVLIGRVDILGRTYSWTRLATVLRCIWRCLVVLCFGALIMLARIFTTYGSSVDVLLFRLTAYTNSLLDMLRVVVFLSALPLFLTIFQSLRRGCRDMSLPELQCECKHFKAISGMQIAALMVSSSILVGEAIAVILIVAKPTWVVPQLLYWSCVAADATAQVTLVSILLGVFSIDASQDRAVQRTAALREQRHAEVSAAYVKCAETAWQERVEELAYRGFSLQSLLSFYKAIPESMPHFDPNLHTTTDVVRQAIIPASANEASSLAQIMNKGVPTRPQRLVTHNWSNLFRDLVAAIVADALNQPTYDLIAMLLDSDMDTLLRVLDTDALQMTFWVCAFSVNQHQSICASNPCKSADPVTGLEHKCCACGSVVYLNDTPPLRAIDQKGIYCQMNKFDDVIAFLSATDPSFAHVIAVDRRFDIFSRAWCVAEVAAADSFGMEQHMKLPSRQALDTKVAMLKHLDVRRMQAARAEDVVEILAKIPDVSAFNARLQDMLFGKEGLFGLWSNVDVFQQAAELGRVALFEDVGRRLCSEKVAVV
eukprot:TRINITY_DN8111_c0_g3_i1.p1 TRINITY_DN8111_c0_g3~~TRINITY_DN8111_c0_g3_i1.p1  ORF type:complete len:674 (-),score=56.01 TRINITY_DN8111_c0_g3_i1:78-2099(-)